MAFKNLLERFGSPEDIFQAKISELMVVDAVRGNIAQKIVRRECTADPLKVIGELDRLDARIVTYFDPFYPPLLKEIHSPPMLFYLRGNDIPQRLGLVSVVGSRHSTHYGVKVAEEIAQGLARRGLGVVSGMARGIDSAAHWGCLGGRGFTVAVLGTGIDVVYPKSNQKLFEHIMAKGAVISELPIGTPPEPKNFPNRNRIISGLSLGVVVVEAPRKSGSLITASLGLEQGREVFAVPGSINSFKSTGCHLLIKQGANLIENADDILDELGLNYDYAPKTDTYRETPATSMDTREKAIYDIIGDYPIHIDQIARQGNMEPSAVSSTLMKMELKGIVRQLPGKMFVR